MMVGDMAMALMPPIASFVAAETCYRNAVKFRQSSRRPSAHAVQKHCWFQKAGSQILSRPLGCRSNINFFALFNHGDNASSPSFDIRRVERYTEKTKEVVILHALIPSSDGSSGADEEVAEDIVVVFRGFSSSLTSSTPFDPSMPVLPPGTAISAVDRAKGPLNPSAPDYISQGISWTEMEEKLQELGC